MVSEAAGGGESTRQVDYLTIELQFEHCLQDLSHPRTGRDAELLKVAAEQDGRRSAVFDAERLRAFEKPVHCLTVELSRLASEAV